MKHRIKGRSFRGNRAYHKSLLRNLSKALIKYEQVVTTVAKAKELRPHIERLVTLGKKGELSNRRQAISILGSNCIEVQKLFSVLAPRYKERNGGYVRILKYGYRKGDCAPMAVIEFLDRDIEAKYAFVPTQDTKSKSVEAVA